MTSTRPPSASAPEALPDAPSARQIARGERLQLVLAGVLWAIAAALLTGRGISWVMGAAWWPLLVLAGAAAGVLKARYILDPVAHRVTARIHARGPGAPISGFFSVRSWLAVVVMIAAGHALRLTAAPRPVLGVLYVAIAMALLVSSRIYWMTHVRGWERIS